MSVHFDIVTAMRVAGLVGFVLGVCMAVYRTRGHVYAGFDLWVSACFLFTAAALLTSFLDALPVFIGTIVADLCLLLFYVFILAGIDRFTNPAARFVRWPAVLTSVVIVVVCWLTYRDPSPRGRIVFMSLAIAAMTLIAPFTVVKRLRKLVDHRVSLIATAFWITGLWCLFRAAHTAFFEETASSFLDTGAVQQLTVVMYTLTSILLVVALMAKTSDRLRSEVVAANRKLEHALSEVKLLQGIIPICSSCKSIRNDEGYYEEVADYLKKHTGANFTHTVCEKCLHELYPDLAAEVIEEKRRLENVKSGDEGSSGS